MSQERVDELRMKSFWTKQDFPKIFFSPPLTSSPPTHPPKSHCRQPQERRWGTLPRLWRISSGQSSTSPNILREVTCPSNLCWKLRARRRESPHINNHISASMFHFHLSPWLSSSLTTHAPPVIVGLLSRSDNFGYRDPLRWVKGAALCSLLT